jgi:membrane protein implicated in regulation of membrane protease activity
VESISPPYYWVKVHGELWRARASEMLAVGDKVVVQKLAGLTLEVARAQTPASRGNGGEA